MNNGILFSTIVFFLFFSVLVLVLFKFISTTDNIDKNETMNNVLLSKNKVFSSEKPNITITGSYKPVTIEEYGCFTNLKNQFFLQQINPYSTTHEYDSGIFISENDKSKKIDSLIQRIIKNGYSLYANKIDKKYKKSGYSGISILEAATLGKLAGYNYISVSKNDFSDNAGINIYLTYSPPTVSSTIYKYGYKFTDEEFDSTLTQSDLPDYSLTPKVGSGSDQVCGFPCLINGKPDTFVDSSGVKRQYMCGSRHYPTLKTPEHFAIYKINGLV
jgi:hypothetical protein